MAVSFPLNSLVDRARVIGALGHEGGYPIIDLIQWTRHPHTVRRAAVGQFGSKELPVSALTAKWSFRQTLLFGGFRRWPT